MYNTNMTNDNHNPRINRINIGTHVTRLGVNDNKVYTVTDLTDFDDHPFAELTEWNESGRAVATEPFWRPVPELSPVPF